MHELTAAMQEHLTWIKEVYKNDEKIYQLYENGLVNTFQTTLNPKADGRTFVITGDIPAMWLRDSAAQMRNLLIFAREDEVIRNLISGVVKQQVEQILIDPYANAFNDGATGQRFMDDHTDMKPEVWERKYEVDSLCYPVQLAYLLWKGTDQTCHFDENFKKACYTIIDVFKTEQLHELESKYRFERDEDEEDRVIYETLPFGGRGNPVGVTGMTWSGFRPSDDACRYGYLIPSNMFAVVILRYMEEIAGAVYHDRALEHMAADLARQINDGIQKYGIVKDEVYGEVYAYEVDGLGNYLLMDDANVPSLLAIPYFGYATAEDPIYRNTRQMLLSKKNPFYYHGKVLKGIGSPHTPQNYVWPIALAVQGMTSRDSSEIDEIYQMLKVSDAGTNLMHEGINVDDPACYTRPWFSWANAMFAEFVLSLNGIHIQGSPLQLVLEKQNKI
ncbi:MAG: metal-independent alpha-mannosidase [Eubacterium sp.]|nr:metal-independent alpha-mannosidase [Eubacterium sp.]